jgi:mevalonate kinase
MRAYASAPGKAILLGEHSVVYRGPAIVLAIDLRAHVWAEERGDSRIQIKAPDIGVAGYFEDGRYHPMMGGGERWRSLNPIRVVAEKAMRRIDVHRGLNIRVESEIPPAVGLGSSAAISVATAAAVGLLLSGEEFSREEVCEIAYEGECIVHGTPSGIDNHISTYGGALRYERGRGFERFGVGELPSSSVTQVGGDRRGPSSQG